MNTNPKPTIKTQIQATNAETEHIQNNVQNTQLNQSNAHNNQLNNAGKPVEASSSSKPHIEKKKTKEEKQLEMLEEKIVQYIKLKEKDRLPGVEVIWKK